MAQAQLNVVIRENTGKGVARKLRAAGKVPAVVYGKGMEPTAITVEPKALEAAVSSDAGWNTLLTLTGAPELEGKVVVLKDLDLHAIRRTMVCADFHAINVSETAHFMVPVTTVGTSVGEKEGGTLQVIRHELEVICLPGVVPQSFDIDVSALQIGDVVHVNEIAVPEGVEIPHDVNFTVITVKGHKAEVEVEGDEDEAAVAEGEAE